MVADGYKETEVGVIPVEWEVKHLDDISELTSSKRVHLSDYVDIGIPFYRGKEITLLKKNETVDDLLYISKEQYNKIKNQFGIPLKNDILITAVGTLANTYRIPNDNPFYFKDGNLIWLKGISENSIFIDYMLGFHKKQILDSAIGSSQKALTIKELKKIKIQLPPLKEQEKIADILSTADEKIDAIEGQIQKAETLKKGLLQKLLSEGIGHSKFKDSELGKIPASWEVVKLRACSELIKDGTHGTHKDVKNGIPLLSAKDIKYGKVILDTDSRKISLDEFNKIHKNYSLNNDDLLLTVVGTLGRVALIKGYNNNYTFQRSVAIIRLLKTSYPKYFYHIFTSLFFQKQLTLHSNASAQAGVYLGELEKLKIPLPPLKEQKQIADILSTADEKLEVLRAKKEKYETLKKGLLQKLLSGKIRVEYE